MSTWLYLECRDHKPPLRADDESGQHLFDLSQIREDIANRETLVKAATLDAWPDDRFRRNSVRFLAEHRTCQIGIRDEYGTEQPLVEPEFGDPTTTAAEEATDATT